MSAASARKTWTAISLGRATPSAARLEEVDQRLVDLLRPLLLHPMASAFEQHRALEVGQHARHALESTLADGPGDHAVSRAGDEQRRLRDHRILPGRHELEVAVHIAIPVEAA